MALAQNLTLNLGLRYEMSTVPTETRGKLANYETSRRNPHLGDPFFSNPTLKNLERASVLHGTIPQFKNGSSRRGWDVRCATLPYQFVLLTTKRLPFFNIPR